MKSTLKFSPNTNREITLITRIAPEIEYHSRLAGDELDGDLAAVEPAADAAERRHHASFAVAGLAVAGLAVAGLAGARDPPRHGARAPSRTGSSPDSG